MGLWDRKSIQELAAASEEDHHKLHRHLGPWHLIMTSIGTLLAFVIVCLGVLILRYREPHLKRPFKTPGVPLVPILRIGVCLLMMVSLNLATWIRLIVWLAIGIAIYFFYSRHHRK